MFYFVKIKKKEFFFKVALATLSMLAIYSAIYRIFTYYPLHEQKEMNEEFATYVILGVYNFFIGSMSLLYFKEKLACKHYRTILYLVRGNFIADSLHMLLYQPNSTLLILHHIITCIMISIYPYYKIETKLVARGLLSELAMPFFYYGRYLVESTHKIPLIKVSVIALGLIITYFVFRVVNFTHIFYTLTKHENKKILLPLFGPIMIMNYCSFTAILIYIFNIFSGFF